MKSQRAPLSVLAVALAAVLFGCAGRSATTVPKTAWVPPQVVAATCRTPRSPEATIGWPVAPYQIAVLVEIDAKGDVAAASVIERWPASQWTRAEERPWEDDLLTWVANRWEIEPARWGNRRIRSSILRVLWVTGRTPSSSEADAMIWQLLGPPSGPRATTSASLIPESIEGGLPARHDRIRPSRGYSASVLIDVSKSGRARSATIVSRLPETLSPFAQPWEDGWLEWIKKDWRFEPETRDGEPVRGQVVRVLELKPDTGLGEVLSLEESVSRGQVR